jgi:hypothetical protein
MLTVPGASGGQDNLSASSLMWSDEHERKSGGKRGGKVHQLPGNAQDEFQNDMNDVPNIKFRDVVLAKKFGSSPYDSDRLVTIMSIFINMSFCSLIVL